jgi:ABC-type transporter Mla subunit MlaD
LPSSARGRTLNLRRSPISDDIKAENRNINALAIKDGFPRGYDLVTESCGAIEVLRQIRDFEKRQRLVREAEPLLTVAKKRASEFARALTDLDPLARKVLLATDSVATENFIAALAQNVRTIQEIAEETLESLGVATVGRPGEPRIKVALADLNSLFRAQFQEADVFRSDASAPHGYAGKFFQFAIKLFKMLEIVRTPEATGKQIQLAIKSVNAKAKRTSKIK